MKILLINPEYRVPQKNIQFPLGLGYIAACLEKAGHGVSVLDLNAERQKRQELKKFIAGADFDMAGISGMITVFNGMVEAARMIKDKNRDLPVICGGTASSSAYRFLLKTPEIDVCALGEGEKTIVSLAGNWGEREKVKGIAFCAQDGIKETGEPDIYGDLGEIPYPAWHLFPMKKYLESEMIMPGIKSGMNMISNRGCPYSCTYCFRNFGGRVRLRGADDIIGEIEKLIKDYGVRHINFSDELFTIDRPRVTEFCEKVIGRKMNFTWRCLSRTDLASVELYRLMKKAGCLEVGFGIESGSDRMLKSMKKHTSVAKAEFAIRAARISGLHVTGTFIIGMPGENEESIRQTEDFCVRNDIYNEIFYATPYPGTELYEYAIKNRVIKDEEGFITSLGNITEYSENLTDMPAARLIGLKTAAEANIRRRRSQVNGLVKLVRYIRNYGYENLFENIKARIFK